MVELLEMQVNVLCVLCCCWAQYSCTGCRSSRISWRMTG
jgi:hypothetical protein